MEFGFIGAGNMGGALALAVSKKVAPQKMALADKDTAKAASLAEKIGCKTADNKTLASQCRFLFLGVKPQFLDGLFREIAPVLAKRKEKIVIVSMAAGVKIEAVRKGLGSDLPVIRIMPNTPASVGKGVILYHAEGTSEEDEAAFCEAMSAAGILDPLPENWIDAASAVSGCGPAFVYLFIEALADGGVHCGLPRDKALRYAAATVEGAAALLLSSGKHPGELKDAVCSPGGTTIEGVRVLEKSAFRSAAMDAVIAAYEKTRSLGK